MRALAGCLALHIARTDDVTARHLYAPSSTLFFVPQLTFMPSTGRTSSRGSSKPDKSHFASTNSRDAAENAVRRAVARALCTGDASNLATQALDELQNNLRRARRAELDDHLARRCRGHVVRTRSRRPERRSRTAAMRTCCSRDGRRHQGARLRREAGPRT